MSTLVSFDRLLELAERKGIRPVLENLEADIMAEKESRKRIPRPPAPEGGIGIREGARKYSISKSTVYKWVKNKLIPIIRDDGWIVYIDESRLAELVKAFDGRPGSWSVKRYIESSN